MKISIKCNSLILEKALELFLKEFITPFKQADIVVSDHFFKSEVPLFLLKGEGAKVSFPFSKTTLLLALEDFYQKKTGLKKRETSKKDFKLLEKKLEDLTSSYHFKIVEAVREFYEGK